MRTVLAIIVQSTMAALLFLLCCGDLTTIVGILNAASLEFNLTHRHIILPTVPRSGNSWTRMILEILTGEPTATVYRGEKHAVEGRYLNDKILNEFPVLVPPCGRIDDCDLITQEHPNPLYIKTHYPFLGFAMMSSPRFHPNAYKKSIKTIREPLGNYDAWNRYQHTQGQKRSSFSHFLNMWVKMHTFWQESTETLTYRFEDMASEKDRKEIFMAVLEYSGISMSGSQVRERLQHPSVLPKNGADDDKRVLDAYRNLNQTHTLENVQLALKHPRAAKYLEEYGYLKLYQFWEAQLQNTDTDSGTKRAVLDSLSQYRRSQIVQVRSPASSP